jgi:RsiW-degrading membrane proteinase PrsW (M82 family)
MPTSTMLLLGVTVPLVGELLKLAGPLRFRGALLFRDETANGAVLGATSGVGYAAASTLVNYWPIVRDGYAPTGVAGLADWSVTLIGLAIPKPLIHGTTSGPVMVGICAATVRRDLMIVPALAGLCGGVVYGLGDLLLNRHGTISVLLLHGLLLAILLTLLWRIVRA